MKVSRHSFSFILVFLVFNSFVFAMGKCTPAVVKVGKTQKGCIRVDGIKRFYRLFVPIGYKGKANSLIVALHGGGGSAKYFEKYSDFSVLSQKSKKFIVIYPEGIKKHWNDGRVNVNANINDVAFIERLIENILQKTTIKKKNIYVSGMSNGGLMAIRIGCESNLVSGVGVVAATMPLYLVNICKNTSKPIAFIVGSEDKVFLNDGRQVSPLNQHKVLGRHLGIEKSLAYWKKKNACKGKMSEVSIIDKHQKKFGKYKDDHTVVKIKRYKSCKKEILFYNVQGGGHRWPEPDAGNGFLIRKTFNLGWASHEISSAEVLWRFFDRN